MYHTLWLAIRNLKSCCIKETKQKKSRILLIIDYFSRVWYNHSFCNFWKDVVSFAVIIGASSCDTYPLTLAWHPKKSAVKETRMGVSSLISLKYNEIKEISIIIYLICVLRRGSFIIMEISIFKINWCYCAFVYMATFVYKNVDSWTVSELSLIHIWRCRRS